jgi:hypothetical protein
MLHAFYANIVKDIKLPFFFFGPFERSFSSLKILQKILWIPQNKKKILQRRRFFLQQLLFSTDRFLFSQRVEKVCYRLLFFSEKTTYFFENSSKRFFFELILVLWSLQTLEPKKGAQGRFCHVPFFLRSAFFFRSRPQKELGVWILKLKRTLFPDLGTLFGNENLRRLFFLIPIFQFLRFQEHKSKKLFKNDHW